MKSEALIAIACLSYYVAGLFTAMRCARDGKGDFSPLEYLVALFAWPFRLAWLAFKKRKREKQVDNNTKTT